MHAVFRDSQKSWGTYIKGNAVISACIAVGILWKIDVVWLLSFCVCFLDCCLRLYTQRDLSIYVNFFYILCKGCIIAMMWIYGSSVYQSLRQILFGILARMSVSRDFFSTVLETILQAIQLLGLVVSQTQDLVQFIWE